MTPSNWIDASEIAKWELCMQVLVTALELARAYVETCAYDGLDVCVGDLEKIDAALALADSVSGGSKASDVSEPVNTEGQS